MMPYQKHLFLFFLSRQVDNDPRLDTKRAVLTVEMVMATFEERERKLSEYWQSWQINMSSKKEFKTQWHQFVQDARKVGPDYPTQNTPIFTHMNCIISGKCI